MNNKIPSGLHKCEVCGEYNGQVMEKDLNHDGYFNKTEAEKSTKYLTVTCLCRGILCPRCHKDKIHRPISNSYDEETNTIGHWPYFAGQMPCHECRLKEKNLKENI